MSEELIRMMLKELGTATQPGRELSEDIFPVYIPALAHYDIPTLSEACSRLMSTEKFFPALSAIREQIRLIRAEEERAEAREIYSRKDWLPQSRATIWKQHLEDTIKAMRDGTPRPAPPEMLDTEGPTFTCRECQDTKFVRVCMCGSRLCADCKWQRYKPCVCRESQEVTPSFKRNARAR